MSASLSVNLLESVLARLGFNRHLEPTRENLRRLYAAWCRRVPFDNVRKLIHVHNGDPRPFPGSTAEDFFEAWLKHGTGGTCWSGAGAFQALLQSLGFDAVRGVGTMMVAPDLPPNHGTVRVDFGEAHYLTDCSILHVEPLHLNGDAEVIVNHPAWGVRCSRRDGKWHVAWRPLHKLDGLECRLESFGASQQEYAERYEKTRQWSPFNYELVARLNKEDRVVGTGFGRKVTLKSDGAVDSHPVADAERRRLLIEDIGLSEEIVSQLPADRPTPPPPWSKTAQT
ncbi:MAG TPA: arylamine N-acetyltransferase [Verrucomicrobiae bacterium]|nr:arylamine N-acetyltransferase [Verrucomicrobiae bacterium]